MTALSLAARQARLLAVRDLITAIDFYPGAAPATPEGATTETLLLSIPIASGTVGAAGTVATLTLTSDPATVAVSGIVAWCRFVDASGNGIMDVPCAATGGTEPVILSTLNVYAGGELQLISCVIAE